MLDFEEHDRMERQRQRLFVATTDRMNTYGFLVKAKLACGRRRENPTPLPVQMVMHDFFFPLAQPTVWLGCLPVLRYAFGKKELPLFCTSQP